MTIDEYADKIAADWPPLTPAQNELIGALLSEPADVTVSPERRSA